MFSIVFTGCRVNAQNINRGNADKDFSCHVDTSDFALVDTIELESLDFMKEAQFLTDDGWDFKATNDFLLSYPRTSEAKMQEQLDAARRLMKSTGQVDEGTIDYIIKNKNHVDSVMVRAVQLLKAYPYEMTFKLLNEEKYNIYSHPNTDSFNMLRLHILLYELGFISLDEKTFLQNAIENFELSRIQVETVQANWQGYHPYYKDILLTLQDLYQRSGNTAKEKEIINKLKAIE